MNRIDFLEALVEEAANAPEGAYDPPVFDIVEDERNTLIARARLEQRKYGTLLVDTHCALVNAGVNPLTI